jgi:hypothetical protein
MDNKTCRTCGQPKSLDQFEKQARNEKTYWRSQCKECKNKYDYQQIRAHPEKYLRKRIKNAEQRWDPRKRAQFILSDSKLYDQQHGLENDLNKPFIEQIISSGCTYCDTKDYKIGLDRIDNKLGHLCSNVVSSCTRCNFIRRDMPYEAWLIIVPSIKEAVQKNLFGDWTGGFHRHHPMSLV